MNQLPSYFAVAVSVTAESAGSSPLIESETTVTSVLIAYQIRRSIRRSAGSLALLERDSKAVRTWFISYCIGLKSLLPVKEKRRIFVGTL